MPTKVPKITVNGLLVNCFIFLLSLGLAFQIVFSAAGQSLLDYVNFYIHESGHIIFAPAGEFMYILGGSFVQLLFPLGFFIYFFLLRRFFASGFTLFWIGNNLTSIAQYMKDARLMQLELHGRNHDWHYLFQAMNVLSYDQMIGNFFYIIGFICIFGGLILMYTMIIIQIQQCRSCK